MNKACSHQAFVLANTIVIEMNGTLTRNEMITSQLIVDHKHIFVSGKGYDPYGTLLCDGKSVSIDPGSSLYMLAQAAYLLSTDVKISINERGSYMVTGSPMDAALQIVAKKMGISGHEVQSFKKIDEIVIENQYRAVLYEYHKKGVVFIAGCPELLVKNQALQSDIQIVQQQGLHALAIAYKYCELHDDIKNSVTESLLLGICGIEDAIRPDSWHAVANARKAGFHIVMTSPHHQQTAIAVAKNVGIYKAGDEAIDGHELHHKGPHYLQEQIMHTTVYSNVTSEQKKNVVTALKDAGLSVIEIEQAVSFSQFMFSIQAAQYKRLKRQRMLMQGIHTSIVVIATIGVFLIFAPFNKVLAMTMSLAVFNISICLIAYQTRPLIAVLLIITQYCLLEIPALQSLLGIMSLNPYQWTFASIIASCMIIVNRMGRYLLSE